MGCSERFPACSARCPKDARGEYGYLAWKAEWDKAKQAEREYKKRDYEEYLRSEIRETKTQKYVRSKYGADIFKGTTKRK
jgi:hypothetical protein